MEGIVADISKPCAAAIKKVFGEQVQVIDRWHMEKDIKALQRGYILAGRYIQPAMPLNFFLF